MTSIGLSLKNRESVTSLTRVTIEFDVLILITTIK